MQILVFTHMPDLEGLQFHGSHGKNSVLIIIIQLSLNSMGRFPPKVMAGSSASVELAFKINICKSSPFMGTTEHLGEQLPCTSKEILFIDIAKNWKIP